MNFRSHDKANNQHICRLTVRRSDTYWLGDGIVVKTRIRLQNMPENKAEEITLGRVK